MKTSGAWWHMPVILALGRLRQEHCEFEASMSYISQKKKKLKSIKI
jgi:hypothetical protein